MTGFIHGARGWRPRSAPDAMNMDALRDEWRRRFRTPPPALRAPTSSAGAWPTPSRPRPAVAPGTSAPYRGPGPGSRPGRDAARAASRVPGRHRADPRIRGPHPPGRGGRGWLRLGGACYKSLSRSLGHHRRALERPALLRPARGKLAAGQGDDGLARLRCAIYTRKSSEEGLEQDFNTLHAQREACEAYVLSQAARAGGAASQSYDDGGFSGGTMERPALTQLLADIAPAGSTSWWSTRSTA